MRNAAANAGMSSCQLKCDLLWALCREHAWGRTLSTQRLLRYGLPPGQRERGRNLLDELLRESYIEYYPNKGYRLKNDPDSQALLASRLTETCGLPAMSVEATLSRFQQAGGFDAYDRQELVAELEAW